MSSEIMDESHWGKYTILIKRRDLRYYQRLKSCTVQVGTRPPELIHRFIQRQSLSIPSYRCSVSG